MGYFQPMEHINVMNHEDQRIAFLEYFGWTDLNRESRIGNYRALRGTSPEGVKNQIAPNPLRDLNVINRAERFLYKNSLSPVNKNGLVAPWRDEMKTAWTVYIYHLDRVVNSCRSKYPTHYDRWALAHASAEDRLEAFLKTLGLWEVQ